MNSTPTVDLRVPLSFYSQDLGKGLITGASKSYLQLRLLENKAVDLSQLVKLDVELDDQKSLCFLCKVHKISSDPSIIEISLNRNENSKAIDELLGRVRKDQHISLCLTEDVEAKSRHTGFDQLNFVPCSLPDMNWSDIDTNQSFLNRQFSAPLMITGMTGGISKAMEINANLAAAAAKLNIPMGIGSQRLAIENSEYEKVFKVKETSPDVFLIGNIGISQIRETDAVATCQRAVDMIDANALAIHLNVLQETVQVEGDRNFSGSLEMIARIVEELKVPVVIKEVGHGMDLVSATKLYGVGVAAIDVGGMGGTSWSRIEGLRSSDHSVSRLGELYRDWGIPTAHAVAAICNTFPDKQVTATGGIRSGQMVAKAVAIGAQMVGIGLPLLKAALVDTESVEKILNMFIKELKTAMICTNSKTLDQLNSKIILGQPYAGALEKFRK